MKLEELRSKLRESKPKEDPRPHIPDDVETGIRSQPMYRCPCCGRGLLAAPESLRQGSAVTLCCNKMVFWDSEARRWAH